MSGFRRPEVERGQLVLWSHRLEDAIPADHPVRLFDILLGSDAFSATFRDWEQSYDLTEGRPPYHPRDLAGLYLYGMLNQLRSSRKLESACYNRLDLIWLLSGQKPDHSTIAEFVTVHRDHLKQLFRDVLAVGLKAGLIKLEHVATDGTKIEADAGKGSVRGEAKIRSWLGHLDERIAALEAEWTNNEQREATLFAGQAPWSPRGGDKPDKRLAAMKRQQARLNAALEELARRQAESTSTIKAIASTTDPCSRSMKDKEGRVKPNYNAQIAVDATAGMIVAEAVNDAADDSGQLTPMLDQVEANCGAKPIAASADSQYNTGPELAALEDRGIAGHLPDTGTNSEAAERDEAQAAALSAARSGETLSEAQWSALPRDKNDRIDKSAFTYDRASNAYRCPAGVSLPLLGQTRDTKKGGVAIRMRYGFAKHRGGAPPPCATCSHGAICCKDPPKGRLIGRDQYEDHRERMRARMNSDAGRALYRERKHIVEPRFGQIKRILGVRRFMRRGRPQVAAEWCLISAAVNIGVLLKHWTEVAAVL
jgi:transposase